MAVTVPTALQEILDSADVGDSPLDELELAGQAKRGDSGAASPPKTAENIIPPMSV